MNFKLTVLVISLLSLAACSKKIVPVEGYQFISNEKNIGEIEDIDLAKSINLSSFRPQDLQLNLADSVIRYNETFVSNYKIFKFKATPSKKYRIIVYSYCDCWGLKKYLFDPNIKIIDENRELVLFRLVSYDFNPNNAPLFYRKEWMTEQEMTGNCYIILYSNNSKLQENIATIIADVYTGMSTVPVPVPINIKSSLVGDFRIILQ